MPKKLTTEEFVIKAISIHGNKYDYSKVVYNKNNEKVIIKCSIHGEFSQAPLLHLSKRGCAKCGFLSMKEKHPNFKSKIFYNSKNIPLKFCNVCKKIKPIDEFHKLKNSKNGRSNCKKCVEKTYKKNRKKAIKRTKKWREENKEKRREQEKRYRAKNPHIYAWRTVLRDCLRRLGQKKEKRTIDLLGYSALELQKHIASLFTPGMSWNNYGKWHIDHIIQVVKFDKKTPMHIVNALSNLRPLWATTRKINGVIYIGNLNRGNN